MAVCIVCLLGVSRSVRSEQNDRPDLGEGNLCYFACSIESEYWVEIAA